MKDLKVYQEWNIFKRFFAYNINVVYYDKRVKKQIAKNMLLILQI